MKRPVSLYLMILFYLATGVNHFIMPSFYSAVVPYYMPYPFELVYISGVLAILFSVLLIPVKTRKIASWLIIIMLLAYMPVHIQMLIDNNKTMGITFWIAFIRIPIQFALIYWSWIIAKKSNEPVFRA